MTLTKAKLAELRRIRDGATPGPWVVDEKKRLWFGVESTHPHHAHDWICHAAGEDEPQYRRPEKENATYIAAFDPPTTGELLDAIEKLSDALDRIESDEPSDYAPDEIARFALREVFGKEKP